MSLFSKGKSLQEQAAETRALKQRYLTSKSSLKSNAHRKATAPSTFIATFAAGCAVGWIATRPKKKVVVRSDGSDDAKVEKKPSLLASTAMRVAGVAGSLVMAEVTKQMSEVVKEKMSGEDTSNSRSNRG